MKQIGDSFDPIKTPHDLHGLKTLLEQHGVDVKIRDHRIYQEAMEKGLVTAAFLAGPDQLIITGKHGVISCVRGAVSFGDFEIFCIEGTLFSDIERFDSEDACCRRIVELVASTRES